MLRRPEYGNVKWSRNSHRICRQSALSSVKWCRSLAAGSYRVRADRFPAWDVSPAVASREEARTGGDGARWRGDHQPPPLYLPLVSISRPQAVTLEAPPAFPATFSLPVQLYLRNLKSSRSSQLPRLTPAPLAPPKLHVCVTCTPIRSKAIMVNAWVPATKQITCRFTTSADPGAVSDNDEFLGRPGLGMRRQTCHQKPVISHAAASASSVDSYILCDCGCCSLAESPAKRRPLEKRPGMDQDDRSREKPANSAGHISNTSSGSQPADAAIACPARRSRPGGLIRDPGHPRCGYAPAPGRPNPSLIYARACNYCIPRLWARGGTALASPARLDACFV